jgi:hypothetical protein
MARGTHRPGRHGHYHWKCAPLLPGGRGPQAATARLTRSCCGRPLAGHRDPGDRRHAAAPPGRRPLARILGNLPKWRTRTARRRLTSGPGRAGPKYAAGGPPRSGCSESPAAVVSWHCGSGPGPGLRAAGPVATVAAFVALQPRLLESRSAGPSPAGRNPGPPGRPGPPPGRLVTRPGRPSPAEASRTRGLGPAAGPGPGQLRPPLCGSSLLSTGGSSALAAVPVAPGPARGRVTVTQAGR